ncbi:DnaJ domain-containing protein [Luteimonas fraxinea]|uniref:DnaJ domain-containing protein n=1 Tax=Luteimonas fraxinea TaxID=2901869 RepID=UPI001E3C14F4|nr:DnaJ domain-containing protein [Luteimonas fraxinea]UHH08581.1 DnaJ domain-containing protein [Luteimonas fraxinea]
MTTGGDALDLALGILRAPARREAAWVRPLPDGMTELLSIASGSPAALRAASARTGSAAAELQEAARFFVQQVLLIADADAYRVLGVTPGASKTLVRDHHRLLLRWLHPDRDGDGQWDSTLSFRVNWAWRHLRNDAARRAYDGHSAGPHHEAGEAVDGGWRSPLAAIPIQEVHQLTRPPRTGVSVPAPVWMITLACVLLGGLVLQREWKPDPAFDEDFAPAVARVTVADDQAAEPSTSGNPADCVPVPGNNFCQALVARRASPQPVALELPEPQLAAAAEESLAPVQLPVFQNVEETPLAALDTRGTTPVFERPVPTTPRNRERALQASYPPMPPATAQPAATPEPYEGMRVHHLRPDPAAQTSSQDEALLALLQEAEAAIAQITRYLAASDMPLPPVWSNVDTQVEATVLRQALHARLQGGGRRRMALHGPQWRIDSERAVLDSGYSIDGWRSANEDGRLYVELQRREHQWLATALHLEPAL